MFSSLAVASLGDPCALRTLSVAPRRPEEKMCHVAGQRRTLPGAQQSNYPGTWVCLENQRVYSQHAPLEGGPRTAFVGGEGQSTHTPSQPRNELFVGCDLPQWRNDVLHSNTSQGAGRNPQGGCTRCTGVFLVAPRFVSLLKHLCSSLALVFTKCGAVALGWM